WGVDDDQRRFFVRFGVSKANYGAPFADRWFRRHDGGVLKPAVMPPEPPISERCAIVGLAHTEADEEPALVVVHTPFLGLGA
ncbi:hypothetical protein DMW43_27465, partial [Serratia marcescens]